MSMLSGGGLNADADAQNSGVQSERIPSDDSQASSRLDSRGSDATPPSTRSRLPSARSVLRPRASAPGLNVAAPRTPAGSSYPGSRLPRVAGTPSVAKKVKVVARKASADTVHPSLSTPMNRYFKSSPTGDQVANKAHYQSKNGPLVEKPLPVDKELPSRPFATFANAMSPSKDSRSLIDAAEQPLRVSPGTPDEADWPTLSPVRQQLQHHTHFDQPRQSGFSPRNTIEFDLVASSLHEMYPNFPLSGLQSHWSVDTPETPASTMPLSNMFNDVAEGHVQPSPSYKTTPGKSGKVQSFMHSMDGRSAGLSSLPAFHGQESVVRSPTMMNLSTQDHRPRSISMTDRTSNAVITGPNIDTDEISPDSSQLTEDSDTRQHSPPAGSFSQPRIANRRSSLPGTPITQPSISKNGTSRGKHHATASRIPIFDPGQAPSIIDIKPRTPVPSAPSGSVDSSDRVAIPTFGGCRLDTPADLAALDKDPHPRARRQPSNRTLRKEGAESYRLAKKVSLANMKHQVRRLTPSPIESERPCRRLVLRKSSMTSAESGERPSYRFQPVPGGRLSNSFQMSTLKIYDDAHDLIMGTRSEQAKADLKTAPYHTDDDSPSPSAEASLPDASNMDVELSLSFNASDQDTPVAQKTMRANVGDLLAASEGQGGRAPGATINMHDDETHQQITATLSLLEGSPPQPRPTRDDFLSFVDTYGNKVHRRVQPPSDQIAARGQDDDSRSTGATTPEQTAETTEDVVKPTDPDESSAMFELPGDSHHHSSRRPSDHKPSYMSPTPASEARRVTKSLARDEKSTTFPSRVSSKASRVLGTGDNDPMPRKGFSRRTPSKSNLLRTGSPGHTPLTRFSESNSKLPVMKSPSLQTERAVDGLRSGHVTPIEPAYKPKHRPRSESKSRFLNNFKGFFTSKREAAPAVPSIDGRYVGKVSRKATLNNHGNPEHGKSAISIAEPVSSSVVTDEKSLPEPLSPTDATSKPSSRLSIGSGMSSLARSPDTAPLFDVITTLLADAGEEPDRSKKERLLYFAKVMLDSVAGSKKAERSMIEAQQAAHSAQLSYEMTQRSVAEMRRLVTNSRGNMSGVLRKIVGKTGH